MSLNHLILIGRLTADPEIRTTTSGHSVVSFRLAVDRKFKNAEGERETDFINITAWRKTAELVQQYCSKGMRVAVDGSLQIRQYQAQDGSNRTASEVVADNVQFLDRGANADDRSTHNPRPTANQDTQEPPQDTGGGGSDDDLPFDRFEG